MTGLLHDPEFPREDWRCLEVADVLEAHDGRREVACEACGTPARFVHVLQHDGFDAEVAVCLACSSSLTGSPAAARAFEAKVRARADARDAWLAGPWYETPQGMLAVEAGGLRMGVFPSKRGGWACRIEGTFFPERWPGPDEARYALFDRYRALAKDRPRKPFP